MPVAAGIRATMVVVSSGIEGVARRPDPAPRADGDPPPVVIRPPAPGFVADPVPAVRIDPGPPAVIVGSPVIRHVRAPDIAVFRCPHPLPVPAKLRGSRPRDPRLPLRPGSGLAHPDFPADGNLLSPLHGHGLHPLPGHSSLPAAHVQSCRLAIDG